jgi:hypothetical protein
MPATQIGDFKPDESARALGNLGEIKRRRAVSEVRTPARIADLVELQITSEIADLCAHV